MVFFLSSVPAVLLVRSWILSLSIKLCLLAFFLAFLVLVYLFICKAMSEADQLREKYFYAHSRKYAHKFSIFLCFLLFSFILSAPALKEKKKRKKSTSSQYCIFFVLTDLHCCISFLASLLLHKLTGALFVCLFVYFLTA